MRSGEPYHADRLEQDIIERFDPVLISRFEQSFAVPAPDIIYQYIYSAETVYCFSDNPLGIFGDADIGTHN